MIKTTFFLSAVALLIVTLLGAATLVGLNSERRVATVRAITEAQTHKENVAELLVVVAGAEAAQREFLLTENPNHLKPYHNARARVARLLSDLNDGALGDDSVSSTQVARDALRQFADTSSQMLAELQETLDVQLRLGREAAVADVQDHDGRRTMDAVRRSARSLEAMLDQRITQELQLWEQTVSNFRMLLISSTVLNVLILIAGAVLFGRHLRQLDELNRQLTKHSDELASQVAHRTAELSSLSSHLQRVAEHEKAAIARELHDELGGLMIAAKMDAAWLEKHPAASHAEMQLRWTRLQKVLDDGLNLKRRVVETLRPTLLDNLGLIPAVKWVYQETCGRVGMNCKERLPAQEVRLTDEAAIAVFRVVQEALTNIVKHAKASDVELNMDVDDEQLRIEVADNGVGMRIKPAGQFAQGVASMKHRVFSLGGTLTIVTPATGGTRIQIQLPLASIAAPDATPATIAA